MGMNLKHKLSRFIKRFTSFVNDESGQSTVEYVLILFMVVLIASKFKETIMGKLNTMLGRVGSKMDNVLNEN